MHSASSPEFREPTERMQAAYTSAEISSLHAKHGLRTGADLGKATPLPPGEGGPGRGQAPDLFASALERFQKTDAMMNDM